MAHIFLSQLKTSLNNCIDELEQIRFLFSRNPETRLMKGLLSMKAKKATMRSISMHSTTS